MDYLLHLDAELFGPLFESDDYAAALVRMALEG